MCLMPESAFRGRSNDVESQKVCRMVCGIVMLLYRKIRKRGGVIAAKNALQLLQSLHLSLHGPNTPLLAAF